jgi:carboxypeptidase T
MKLLQHLLLAACFCLLGIGTSHAQIVETQKYSRIRIFTDEAGMQRLNDLGIAADHGQYRRGAYFETDLSATEINKVQQAGFNTTIVHDNVIKYYQERAAADFERMSHASAQNPNERSSADCSNSNGLNYTVPTNFNLGSMGGFFTYNEMIAHLDNMRALFPDHISEKQAIDTFQTHENRPVYWLKISDNPDTDETDEPEVLINAVHHAREPGGLSQLIFFMYYLLENYHTNPEIQFLLDHTEMYIVPCINPDGYIYNQTTNPNGGGFWRKNKRDNNGNGVFNSNADGVDLNRNYGYEWAFDDTGSSPNQNSDTYRGDAAFSEPETQAMKWFCEQHQFEIALNYHTYSNLLIYPWGFIASYLTPDSSLFENYARVMTKENNYTYGTGDQTVGYLTNGDSDDWMYGEQTSKNKILSMTPEAGSPDDGFWPTPSRIIPLCKENVWQNMHLLRFVHNYAELKTDLPTFVSTPVVDVPFVLKRLGLKNDGSFTVSIQPISANIAAVSSPLTFTSLDLLEEVTANLSYTLLIDATGDIIYDMVVNNNEGLTLTQRVIQQYGSLDNVYQNNCDNTTNFIGTWASTTQQYYTAPASITESPDGEYLDNTDSFLYLNDTINLTNATTALLHFYAKWDIEDGYDYTQLTAVDIATGIYTPLCGKYTSAGSQYQLLDEPLYDGTQTNWVREEIDLTDFLGKKIQLRWAFYSDGFVTGDGFYFDDLAVDANIQFATAIEPIKPTQSVLLTAPQPNPATDRVQIAYHLPENITDAVLKVTNAAGLVVMSQKLKNTEGNISLDTRKLTKGLYLYRIEAAQTTSDTQKLVIVR